MTASGSASLASNEGRRRTELCTHLRVWEDDRNVHDHVCQHVQRHNRYLNGVNCRRHQDLQRRRAGCERGRKETSCYWEAAVRVPHFAGVPQKDDQRKGSWHRQKNTSAWPRQTIRPITRQEKHLMNTLTVHTSKPSKGSTTNRTVPKAHKHAPPGRCSRPVHPRPFQLPPLPVQSQAGWKTRAAWSSSH